MKDLRNKSGVLPAQFTNSRVDCGIAWSEHRKVERVKRDDIIRVEAPDLSAHLKEKIDGCMIKLRSQYEELSRISAKAGMALKELGIHEETLNPIDPQTIQVGDTVRLVGEKYKSRSWAKNMTHGKEYVVTGVDREDSNMPITVINDTGGEYWLFGEDLALVESE